MNRAAGNDDQAALGEFDTCSVAPERKSSFEDAKEFFLIVVDMRWRSLARWHLGFQHTEATTALFSGNADQMGTKTEREDASAGGRDDRLIKSLHL